MSHLDLDSPQPCAFCGTSSTPTQALLMPWRECEGWWTCTKCYERALVRARNVMDRRRILGTISLPEWFRNWGVFCVRRTSGKLCDMVIVDWECSFSMNKYNSDDAVYGRVRLSGGEIFIDMAEMVDDDSDSMERNYKQVPLSNIYENNPWLREQGSFDMTFPPYVKPETQAMWNKAIEAVVDPSKNEMAMDVDDGTVIAGTWIEAVKHEDVVEALAALREQTLTEEQTEKPIAEPKPEPVAEASEPVAEAPEPVREASEPVAEASEPVAEAPEAVTEAPEAVTEAPDAQSEPDQSSADLFEAKTDEEPVVCANTITNILQGSNDINQQQLQKPQGGLFWDE